MTPAQVSFANDFLDSIDPPDYKRCFGQQGTKRLILEVFDAIALADRKGTEYETMLDPPPADPSLCHPESTRPSWARASRSV